MLKKIKQYFCKHNWKCSYIYGSSADWKCTKCEKYKKGYAPFGLTNEDIAKELTKDYSNKKIS